MNSLRAYYRFESRAAITNGNWINPTYLPSTRSAQRIKLPEIIAAQDTEIESEYVIAEQVHRRERLIGHHFFMETREEVTRYSHVGLNSPFHYLKSFVLMFHDQPPVLFQQSLERLWVADREFSFLGHLLYNHEWFTLGPVSRVRTTCPRNTVMNSDHERGYFESLTVQVSLVRMTRMYL